MAVMIKTNPQFKDSVKADAEQYLADRKAFNNAFLSTDNLSEFEGIVWKLHLKTQEFMKSYVVDKDLSALFNDGVNPVGAALLVPTKSEVMVYLQPKNSQKIG